jgi:hypothetical protein
MACSFRSVWLKAAETDFAFTSLLPLASLQCFKKIPTAHQRVTDQTPSLPLHFPTFVFTLISLISFPQTLLQKYHYDIGLFSDALVNLYARRVAREVDTCPRG